MTSTALALAADVILRDGRTLRLRPPELDDREALTTFLTELSPESLRLRFHGTVRPRAELVDPYLAPSWRDRGALVGAYTDVETERIVALASYARLRDPAAAEVAFAVSDSLQGFGIATGMLEQLAARAASEGIERLVFEILPGNEPMLHVVADAGFGVSRRRANGVIEATMLIEPTSASTARADERDHPAVVASLRRFLAPASIAVYGASPRRGSIGGALFRNVLAAGFEGPVHAINREGETVAGEPGRRTLGGVDEAVDLALICVPSAAVMGAAADALRAGVRALCVVSASCAEVGSDGVTRLEALLALVRAHGGRLIGPNCLGIAATGPRLNATLAAQPWPSGVVGFALQRGALGLMAVEQSRARGLGLSSFVSLGDKADVSSNDLLEYWEDDEATSVIALYLESFGNPRRFGRIARRVARRKPVLALTGGATETPPGAPASRTAALASSAAAADAVFRQAGVQRARTLSEFLDAAALLSRQPLPHGARVAVLTNAADRGLELAAACAAEGLETPRPSATTQTGLGRTLPPGSSLANPIEVPVCADGETFAAAVRLLLADQHFDAVCVVLVGPLATTAADVMHAVDVAIALAHEDKPVLGVYLSSEAGGDARWPARVVSVASPAAAARALAVAAERAAWLRRPAGVVPELAHVQPGAARAIVAEALAGREDAWLNARQSRLLLESYDIRLAPDADAVGVRPPAVAAIEPRAAELHVGVTHDPNFGPLVAIGPGRAQAELGDAASFGLAPLTDIDALELLAQALGHGGTDARVRPPLDAITDLLHRLSALAVDVSELVELDLDVSLAGEGGYCAVARRAHLRRQLPTTRLKSW